MLFPTGTKVIVEINEYDNVDYYINILIEPSPQDVNQTTGLCGNLNGLKDELVDFDRASDFYKHWR